VVGECPCGGRLPQTPVRAVVVVVMLELAQHGGGVPLVDDQETVE
jgi:hypothetical protein